MKNTKTTRNCSDKSGTYKIKMTTTLKVILKMMEQKMISYFNHFTTPTASNRILAWKSRVLSEGSIKPPAAADNSLAPGTIFNNTKIPAKFDGL